jgi:hypothetical protein
VNASQCSGLTTEKCVWSSVAIVVSWRRSATATTDASTKLSARFAYFATSWRAYPVNETASTFGDGVEKETTDPAQAYARFGDLKPMRCPEEFPSP